MTSRCTVRFQRAAAGPAAVLMWRGHSLNYVALPKGKRVSVAQARAIKAHLMRGCTELVRDYQRNARRGFRDGAPAAAALAPAPAAPAPAAKPVAGARRRRRRSR